MLCQVCRGLLQITMARTIYFTPVSRFSTTQALERKKKIVKPRHQPSVFGVAFKKATGQAVGEEERYGPFVDQPDYTFLDGRPTPLTPEQIELRNQRKEIAGSVMAHIKDVTDIKTYNENKLKLVEEERQKILSMKLKPKSDS